MRRLVLTLALVGLLTGCAAPSLTTRFEVAPGEYARAFGAVKDELRRFGFELDRIDASGGIITTRSKGSAGLASPWEQVETTLTQEWEGLMHNERRRVRVVFESADSSDELTDVEAPGARDLRRAQGPITARVHVVMLRSYRPGLRVSATSIRLSNDAVDPQLARQGLLPTYSVTMGEDDLLAGRVAKAIQKRLEAP